MTLPRQGQPQYELKRRIADCRERLRRTRPEQRPDATSSAGRAAAAPAHDAAMNVEQLAAAPPRGAGGQGSRQ